jgi:hypothetical protein
MNREDLIEQIGAGIIPCRANGDDVALIDTRHLTVVQIKTGFLALDSFTVWDAAGQVVTPFVTELIIRDGNVALRLSAEYQPFRRREYSATVIGPWADKARGYYGIGIYHFKSDVNVGTLWRTGQILNASFFFTVGRQYERQASDTMAATRHLPLFSFGSTEDARHLRAPAPSRLHTRGGGHGVAEADTRKVSRRREDLRQAQPECGGRWFNSHLRPLDESGSTGAHSMCRWGHTVNLVVPIPADLSHTGEARWAEKAVDSCIADLVRALNAGGVLTRSCCCGHGKEEGSIILQDGRVLVVRQQPKG